MDDFLNELRAAPSAEFSDRLRRRLDRQRMAPLRSLSLRGAAIAALLLAAVLIAGPGLGVSAGSLLDFFNIRSFTPVRVDLDRDPFGGLLDTRRLIGRQVRWVTPQPHLMRVTDLAEGEREAGMTVRRPARLPAGFALAGVHVMAASSVEIVTDAALMRNALKLAGMTDLVLPAGFDHQRISISQPPVLSQTFRNETGDRIELIELQSPSIAVPGEFDLGLLVEIALRFAGMPAPDARSLARSVDWRTSLAVPVPASFRAAGHVKVNGTPALLIETTAPQRPARQLKSALFWSAEGRIFGLISTLPASDLPVIANSLN
jgi:hypothetical protein